MVLVSGRLNLLGTSWVEPAASDVTGASPSPLFSAKYMFTQWVTGDIG